ncbi:uncharacterized protein MKK02DRAFT_29985 [Dioszegia hungarica]|uniref:Uncharacterized protein n=1 Tax=Dioszegia hungarica TaxID=4972 RepID=A0AA38H2N2_9TREE|nr:uncharacterized protein MKK02DRAFT_29985 [Dioszegia hungarica]KAI9632995.1 hypothetical protein MKK02DRAFT_29985 [Dioszegia hungarica]
MRRRWDIGQERERRVASAELLVEGGRSRIALLDPTALLPGEQTKIWGPRTRAGRQAQADFCRIVKVAGILAVGVFLDRRVIPCWPLHQGVLATSERERLKERNARAGPIFRNSDTARGICRPDVNSCLVAPGALDGSALNRKRAAIILECLSAFGWPRLDAMSDLSRSPASSAVLSSMYAVMISRQENSLPDNISSTAHKPYSRAGPRLAIALAGCYARPAPRTFNVSGLLTASEAQLRSALLAVHALQPCQP